MCLGPARASSAIKRIPDQSLKEPWPHFLSFMAFSNPMLPEKLWNSCLWGHPKALRPRLNFNRASWWTNCSFWPAQYSFWGIRWDCLWDGADNPICSHMEDEVRPLGYEQSFPSPWIWVVYVGPCLDPLFSVFWLWSYWWSIVPEDSREAPGIFSLVSPHTIAPMSNPPLAPRAVTPFPPKALGHKSGSHLGAAPPSPPISFWGAFETVTSQYQ